MQIYLAVTPDRLRQALSYTDRPAHVAYRVGEDGRLTRHSLLAATRGGLMVLGDGEGRALQDPVQLCREVWRECGNRGYTGVIADFEGPVSDARTAFLCRLGEVLARNRRQLLVPEPYGRLAPTARAVSTVSRSRMPPEPFTRTRSDTAARISFRSSMVQPLEPYPVEVLTKSAPAASESWQARTFCASVR